MHLIEGPGKRCHVERLDKPGVPDIQLGGRLFPCLVWDHVGSWSSEERARLALALLRQGCRYALCAGPWAKEWDATFDMVFVEEYLYEPETVRDEKYMMTSALANEPPEEVAWFFLLGTSFDYHLFSDYLVLHIGSGPQLAVLDDALRQVAQGG